MCALECRLCAELFGINPEDSCREHNFIPNNLMAFHSSMQTKFESMPELHSYKWYNNIEPFLHTVGLINNKSFQSGWVYTGPCSRFLQSLFVKNFLEWNTPSGILSLLSPHFHIHLTLSTCIVETTYLIFFLKCRKAHKAMYIWHIWSYIPVLQNFTHKLCHNQQVYLIFY